MLANQCLWNKVGRKLFLNDSTQIKQRQAILFRNEPRERGALDMASFKQLLNKGQSLGARLLGNFGGASQNSPVAHLLSVR